MQTQNTLSIAVLGLGAMGSRMAKNLLSAGYQVTVWNRSEGPIQDLKKQGAFVAVTPREAARHADFVLCMVRDDIASRNIWGNPETGALGEMKTNAVAIESSTLSPNWTRELGELCKGQGIAFLEAPVAGSRPQADSAQLIYFIGGDMDALKRAEPIFKTLGASIHHTGAVGNAAVIKLFVNALFGLQVAGIAELLGMVRNAGMDPAKALDIFGSTPVASPAIKFAGSAMLARNFTPMFPIELVKKDFEYLLQTSNETKSETPVLKAVDQVLADAIERELGQSNITSLGSLY
jgi:3-hydroxyisobutyrate dehydrogenase